MAFTSSAPRNTKARNIKSVRSYPVLNDAIIYAGTLVVLEAGEAMVVADSYSSTAHKIGGRAMDTVDNSEDGLSIRVEEGEFLWTNGATLDSGDVGKVAYALTDSSVTDDSANHSAVGVITEVTSEGVWVLGEIA